MAELDSTIDDMLRKKREIDDKIDEISRKRNEMNNGIGYRKGGKVSGYGIGDKVPILAEPGEYVIPKKVVKEKGTKYFDKMIGGHPKGWYDDYVGAGGEGRMMPATPPKYQEGGIVEDPNDVKVILRKMLEDRKKELKIGTEPAQIQPTVQSIGANIPERPANPLGYVESIPSMGRRDIGKPTVVTPFYRGSTYGAPLTEAEKANLNPQPQLPAPGTLDTTSAYDRALMENAIGTIGEEKIREKKWPGVEIYRGMTPYRGTINPETGRYEEKPTETPEEEARRIARGITKTVDIYNAKGQKVGTEEVPDIEKRALIPANLGIGEQKAEIAAEKNRIAEANLAVRETLGLRNIEAAAEKLRYSTLSDRYTSWSKTIDQMKKQTAQKYKLSDTDSADIGTDLKSINILFGNKGLSADAAKNYYDEITALENISTQGYAITNQGGNPFTLLEKPLPKSTAPKTEIQKRLPNETIEQYKKRVGIK